jgi:hypothetical protein
MVCRFLLLALTLVACLALAGAATVTVNGKTVAVPMIEKDGKAYVDAAALMKVLGGKASYDAKAHKVAITAAGAPTGSAAAGTAQLAGDNGEFNKIYTLRKDRQLYFSLKSAAYTTARVCIGNRSYYPKADEKLLLLRFTIQNPQKEDTFVRGDGLKFMAVDAMNVNHSAPIEWGDAESRNYVAINLKPAQKLEVYTVITVPAKGEIPKLMVQPNDDGPVLRYDLRGKVTPLPAPIADPNDEKGASARPTVPAQPGVTYPYAAFDITVEKTEYATTTIGKTTLKKGERCFIATLLLKNLNPGEKYLRFDSITPVLTSTDGEPLRYCEMLLATADRPVAMPVRPDSETRVRLTFLVPEGATAKTLALKEGDTRIYEYALVE